ncbi:MAG: hypothetical protein ACPHLK_06385, partial [Gammaproteobacteria bacterium]
NSSRRSSSRGRKKKKRSLNPKQQSLIAGIVGGKRAGGIMAGITAALLPGIIFAVILTFAGAFLPTLPIVGAAIGALVGISTLLIYVLYIPPLLIGALIGGLLA